MTSTMIPNSFQTPNAVVDRLMPFLSESELRCLLYAIRHIMGWHSKAPKKQAIISISNFQDGFVYTDSDGNEHRYEGTGLSRGSILKATKSLVELRILSKVDETRNGTKWGLDFLISDDVDFKTLEERRKSKKKSARKQTATARNKLRSIQQTTDSQSIKQTDVVSSTDLSGLSNRHNETHEETHEETHDSPSDLSDDKKPSPEKPKPRDVLFDAIAYYGYSISTKNMTSEQEKLLKSSGGRIGKVKKALLKINPDFKDMPEDDIRQELISFWQWLQKKWRLDFGDQLSSLRDDSKWAEYYTEYHLAQITPDENNSGASAYSTMLAEKERLNKIGDNQS